MLSLTPCQAEQGTTKVNRWMTIAAGLESRSVFCWKWRWMESDKITCWWNPLWPNLGCSWRCRWPCSQGNSNKQGSFSEEKKDCGALGGPRSAIFGTIALDPLYFEVHIFSDPPDPHYMSINAQLCYLEPFFGVPLKTYPQSRGLPWTVSHWKFGPKLYVGSMTFHFLQNFQWESFHLRRQRHRQRRSIHFLKFRWKIEIIFFCSGKN